MNSELYQLLLSAKIGDGSYINQRITEPKTYRLYTSSVCEDYIEYKKQILHNNNIYTKDVKCISGYSGKSKIYGFNTAVTKETTTIGRMSISEVLDNLNKQGLIYYYLDDGSLHKKKHFMHLYCNMFDEQCVTKLKSLIFEFYPIKECSVRYDIKKDGRKFPYLYIPVATATAFSFDVKEFLMKNDIKSLLYKTI